jgi:isoleucyl-tRNA synthetase
MMRRVEDVLDCWFESGSMPFAQLHYPFENKERFEENFPGDFIVEYVAQTRGWFYTMMVLSTALFDRAPFRNAVCHGVVLDENYQKLSKRLKNYPDPREVFATYGADALRWYMSSSPLMSGGDLAMPKDGSDIGKSMSHVIVRAWNTYNFFTLYANLYSVEARFRADSENVLDRYLLAKMRRLVESVQERLDTYDIPGACELLPAFIDALNNWYLRGRRDMFWLGQDTVDRQSAFDTLFTALVTFCKVAAPLLPFVTEKMYRGLTSERSVHLADWPDNSTFPDDRTLVEKMDLAREVCSAVLTLRETSRLRTRLPLPRLTIAHPRAESLRELTPIISEFINVKSVDLLQSFDAYGTHTIKVNPKIGAAIGAKMKDVMAAQRTNAWALLNDGRVEIAGLVLEPKDFELRVAVKNGLFAESFDKWRGLVVLDDTITPDLRQEGWARDFVRLVQLARKDARFEITDRIAVAAVVPPGLGEAIERHRDYICRETLTVNLTLGPIEACEHTQQDTFDGMTARIGLRKM